VNKPIEISVGKQVWFAFAALCAVLLLIGGWHYSSRRAIERGNQVEQSRALKKLAVLDDIGQDLNLSDTLIYCLPTSSCRT
jgi:flagellar biogenesis protein FliO